MAGDHDDLGGARAGRVRDVAADGSEDVEAIGFAGGAAWVGEPDVEEDGLVVSIAEKFEGLGGGAGGGDDVVFLVEDGFEGFADVGFVVDDENVVHKGRV
jgi:hypothetical protein